MNLKHLTDQQLVLDLKNLVKKEKIILTQILHHLKEIDSRKLFSHYNCKSLYEYALKELGYTESQAYRRIQAMRLLKDLPELEQAISSGSLSLSNLTQAQVFFKESKIQNKEEKIKMIQKMENKSVREAQKEILKLSPEKPLPRETQKQVSPQHKQVSFNMSEELENKLEDIKALLGPKAYNMNFSELVELMANLSKEKLLEKKFGQRRVRAAAVAVSATSASSSTSTSTSTSAKGHQPPIFLQKKPRQNSSKGHDVTGRYLSSELKHFIWNRDQGKCSKCGSHHNLQYDHIKPLALGGPSEALNLRLLCFQCNQRQRITAGFQIKRRVKMPRQESLF